MTPGFRGFHDPLVLVDRTDLPYEERLAILQAWQADLSKSDGTDEAREAVQGAIQALEMGAEVQDDGPEGAPDESRYGKG